MEFFGQVQYGDCKLISQDHFCKCSESIYQKHILIKCRYLMLRKKCIKLSKFWNFGETLITITYNVRPFLLNVSLSSSRVTICQLGSKHFIISHQNVPMANLFYYTSYTLLTVGDAKSAVQKSYLKIYIKSLTILRKKRALLQMHCWEFNSQFKLSTTIKFGRTMQETWNVIKK